MFPGRKCPVADQGLKGNCLTVIRPFKGVLKESAKRAICGKKMAQYLYHEGAACPE